MLRRPGFASARAALTACILVASAGAGGANGVPESSFTALGDLDGGEFRSAAHAVSADGATVVGESSSADGTIAFRWTAAGGLQSLGDLPGGGVVSTALAVSADGSVVVGSSQSSLTTPFGNEAFRWTAASGMTGLGEVAGGMPASAARGVSADGSRIAGASSTGTAFLEAVRWTDGVGPSVLPDLDGGTVFSDANAVSADGRVIVGRGTSSDGNEAARWTDGVPAGLGDLPGGLHNSNAFACSADGSVVVGQGTDASGTIAVRWVSGAIESLGDLAGGFVESAANACSSDGAVVVGRASDDDGVVAFVWTAADGMRRVADVLLERGVTDVQGWRLLTARGVSADGRTVVGEGLDPQGRAQAWAAVLGAPLPSTRSCVVTKVKLTQPARSRASLRLGAQADTGATPADLSGPLDLAFGPVALRAPSFTWSQRTGRWTHRGDALTVTLTPADGSSRVLVDATFTGDLTGAPASGDATVTLSGSLGGTSVVALASGRFAPGRGPGDLRAPALHPRSASASVPDGRPHTIALEFAAAAGVVPADAAPTVRVAFGAFTATIDGASFRRSRGRWVFSARAPGVTNVTLDGAAETVTLRASGVDAGAFAAGPNVVPLALEVGSARYDATVRMRRARNALRY